MLILIDEYDSCFNHMLYNKFGENDPQKREQMSKEREKVGVMLTSILSSALKSNPALFMGVLPGIYDTLQKEGEPCFNNVNVRGINDLHFS